MLDKSKKIALVLGGGYLTELLIKECKKKNLDFFIIGVKEYYIESYKSPADYTISYNSLGSIFKILMLKKIKNIIFLGNVKKVSLFRLRPNLMTFYYILKLIFSYHKGDDYLLRKIITIFHKKGFNIIDSRDLLHKYLATDKKNNLEKHSKIISKETIKKYFELAKEFGKKDQGQTIIVSNNKVVLSEDRDGTDKMIERYNCKKSRYHSFLVKVSKPDQELKIDLPTIGPSTIHKIIDSGIKGIILEKEKTYISDIDVTYDLIMKNNLLYYAI